MPICRQCNRTVWELTADGICKRCNRIHAARHKANEFGRRAGNFIGRL